MRKFLRSGTFIALALVTVAAAVVVLPTIAQPVTTTPSGLQIIDTKPGTGASPKSGKGFESSASIPTIGERKVR